MNYLYRRHEELKKEIKELEKDCFNPQVRPYLKELRAREEEVRRAIMHLEHDID